MITEIKFRCPACNRKLSVRPEAAGKKIRCPACEAKIEIPLKSRISGGDGCDRVDEPISGQSETAQRTEAELNRLQEQCRILQEKVDQLSSDLNRHVVDLEASRKHEKELDSQLTKYKADKLRDADTRCELEERLQRETAAREKLEAENKKQREELSAKESALERSTLECERARQEVQQLQEQIHQASRESETLRGQLLQAERGLDTVTSLNARLEGLEVEREELLRNNQILSAKLEQKQEAQEQQPVNPGMLDEIHELETRKKELTQELLQARSVMMDAANIMGKTKAMQDKIEALSKENTRLRQMTGQPGHSAGSLTSPTASRSASSASRTFGKETGASSLPGESSLPGSESKKLKLKTQSDRPVGSQARGDGKNKFAKSLFGSVRSSKTP